MAKAPANQLSTLDIDRRSALTISASLLAGLTDREGPVARHSKQDRVFNVKEFGARGDGTTDDTAAIQRAIDAAQASGGGLVYVPPGRYILSSDGSHCLRVTSDGISLCGCGFSSVFVCRAYTRVSSLLCIESAAPRDRQITGVTIESLRFDGNRAAQRGAYQMKNLVVNVSDEHDSPSHILLRTLWTHDAYSGVLPIEGGGISVEGSDHRLRDGPQDLRPWAETVVISNCFAYDNGGWGIGTNWSSAITVVANVTHGNATMGITCWNSQDGIVANNFSYDNGDRSLNIEACDRLTVVGNHLSDGRADAVSIYNSRDVLFASNRVRLRNDYWDAHALRISSGPGYGTDHNTDYRQRSSERVQVFQNVITKEGKDGYALMVAAPNPATPAVRQKNILISGNELTNTGNVQKCVSVTADDAHFTSNTRVLGAIDLNTVTSATCFGNVIEIPAQGTRLDAVRIRATQLVAVEGNFVTSSEQLHSFVRVAGLAPERVHVEGNFFIGSGEYLLLAEDDHLTPVLRNNFFEAGIRRVANDFPIPPVRGWWAAGTIIQAPAGTSAVGLMICKTSGRPGEWSPMGADPHLGRRAMPTDDGSPSVAGATYLEVSSLGAGMRTPITELRGGADGQELTVVFLGSATVKSGAQLLLAGERDFVGAAGDTITLIHVGGRWLEKSRSANGVRR